MNSEENNLSAAGWPACFAGPSLISGSPCQQPVIQTLLCRWNPVVQCFTGCPTSSWPATKSLSKSYHSSVCSRWESLIKAKMWLLVLATIRESHKAYLMWAPMFPAARQILIMTRCTVPPEKGPEQSACGHTLRAPSHPLTAGMWPGLENHSAATLPDWHRKVSVFMEKWPKTRPEWILS